jgi:hypothetical protein
MCNEKVWIFTICYHESSTWVKRCTRPVKCDVVHQDDEGRNRVDACCSDACCNRVLGPLNREIEQSMKNLRETVWKDKNARNVYELMIERTKARQRQEAQRHEGCEAARARLKEEQEADRPDPRQRVEEWLDNVTSSSKPHRKGGK